MSVLDLGCGPGNLIDALRYKPRELVGVDLSESALEIASKKAHAKGFPFEKIKGDIRSLRFDKTYDIVISVNSILPPTRSDIKLMLRTAREAVDFHGMFYAILPSFDTTQFLRELWYKHFIKTYGDVEHAKRCVEQIDRAKRVNRQECLYADDGRYQQAYHTPETIRREFLESQLRITQGPQKVRYPWELTRPFDYGYFPEADEEIWDWYVVAQRG